jgi:LysR family glycine cleavage system transcriptional activator
MSRRLPPLKALRIFEVAARTENFAMAAEELFLTASAVSHQVKALEEHLGVKLFERTKRHVKLTATGESYLQSIKESLNGIEVATQRITRHHDQGVITIDVAPNFLIRWLLPRLGRFQAGYPSIELQLNASHDVDDLYANKVDLSIIFGHGDWRDLKIDLLSRVYLVPVCAPGLITEDLPLKEPGDLRQYPLIHVIKRLYEWPEWLQQHGVEYSGFGRGMQLSSSQLATSAAYQKLGMALADRHLSAAEIDSGNLVMPFDSALNTRKGFYLAQNKSRPLTDAMKTFKDWLMTEMHQPAD